MTIKIRNNVLLALPSIVSIPIIVLLNATVASSNTIFTKQITINVKQNNISGQARGGDLAVSGIGVVVTPALPSLDTDGRFSGAAFTAAANSAFSYSSTGRPAEASVLSTATLSGSVVTGEFYNQNGAFSSLVTGGTVGSMSINRAGAANVVIGDKLGSTSTVKLNSSLTNKSAQTSINRTASSSNDQELFTAKAQSSSFAVAGDGVSPVAGGGFNGGASTYGDAVPITVLAGATCSGGTNCLAGSSWNLTHSIRPGQDASVLSASSTNTTKPAFGQMEITAGGDTAGSIVITNQNNLTVDGGGAGTKSELTLSQTMTAFD